jgi:hypothetical protein
MRQSSSGTNTAATPRKKQPGGPSIQTTAGRNCTAEPSGGEVVKQWLVHPQSGLERVLSMEEEYICSGGERFGIRVTSPAVVNCVASIDAEE